MRRALRREFSTLFLAGAAVLALGGRRRLALTTAIGALGLRWWPARRRSLQDAVVVITGGSRGLGLALAEQFLRQGAWVALLARDRDELRRAQIGLAQIAPGRTLILPCDVTDAEQLDGAIRKVDEVFGELDVLVNNAGAMAVAPLETLTEDDFQRMLNLSVHAIVGGVRSARPIFRRQGHGHVVNICSLGGKIGVPHMASYCAGKFALAGLSASMEPELRNEGVDVTTVYPGIMRVGSALNGEFKGDPEKEYAWFALSAVLPAISISAESAAEQIVAAVGRGDSEVIFPSTARMAVLGQKLFPEISLLVRQQIAGLFPHGELAEALDGSTSRDWLESRWWFRPFRERTKKLEERWNQV